MHRRSTHCHGRGEPRVVVRPKKPRTCEREIETAKAPKDSIGFQLAARSSNNVNDYLSDTIHVAPRHGTNKFTSINLQLTSTSVLNTRHAHFQTSQSGRRRNHLYTLSSLKNHPSQTDNFISKIKDQDAIKEKKSYSQQRAKQKVYGEKITVSRKVKYGEVKIKINMDLFYSYCF